MSTKVENHFKTIFPEEIIQALCLKLMTCFQEVFHDFNLSNDLETKTKVSEMGSYLMRLIGCRFLDNHVLQTINVHLSKIHSHFFDTNEFLFHILFYTRFDFPEEKRIMPSPLLISQPHYDRAFGIHAQTFWIPFTNILKESPALCFLNSGAKNFFAPGKDNKNPYNYNLYKKDYSKIDPFIINKMTPFPCQKGDVISFDSNQLHGAFKTKKNERISLDIRILSKDTYLTLDSKLQKGIHLFNDNINVFNALWLYYLKDSVGVERCLSTMSYSDISLFEKERNKIKCFFKINKVTDFHVPIRYQDELDWLKYL